MAARAPLITGVDFVFVPTTDFAAASRFYGELLGLRRSATYGRMPGGEFETGNLTLQVIESASLGRSFEANTNPIALRVEDVASARAELEAKGVAFRGETLDTGVCHMATFADPDGNLYLLHRRYAPPAATG
jgi:catechol 2,3-dioxygenase-like lactoylglutathione lyase family enzyme